MNMLAANFNVPYDFITQRDWTLCIIIYVNLYMSFAIEKCDILFLFKI